MRLMTNSQGEVEIYDFDAVDAFKIAIKLETDGMEFYRGLAMHLDNSKIKDVMGFLVGEEKKHLQFFEDQLEKMREDKEDGFEEDSLVTYLDSGVFSQFRKIQTASEDLFKQPVRAVKLGIIVEEDTVKFYRALLKNTKEKTGKEALKEIIEEEIKHKERLEKILKLQNGIEA